MQLRFAGQSMKQAIIPQLSEAEIDQHIKRWSEFGFSDYMIVTADKPTLAS